LVSRGFAEVVVSADFPDRGSADVLSHRTTAMIEVSFADRSALGLPVSTSPALASAMIGALVRCPGGRSHLKRWSGFTRFLDDGRIDLSNNAAERALRGIALGRKSWLFAGSDRGGQRAAIMYSLIGTAKLNDVEPQAWLADVLAITPITPPTKSTISYLGIGRPNGCPPRRPPERR
jgi:hypothetical protein